MQQTLQTSPPLSTAPAMAFVVVNTALETAGRRLA